MKFLHAVLLSCLFGITALTANAATIDINTADATTLDRGLKGVGAKTAAAIVAYRTKHGPFKSVDDLVKVKGVGPATLEKNRAKLSVGGVTKTSTPAAAGRAPAPAAAK